MIDWMVASFLNPTDKGFRTCVVTAASADDAVRLAGEVFAIAVPAVQRKVVKKLPEPESRVDLLRMLII